MRSRPGLPLIVVGTLIALAIWYGRPVLAQLIESAGDWERVLEGAVTPIAPRLPWGEAPDGDDPVEPTPPADADDDPLNAAEGLIPALARGAAEWALRDAELRLELPEGKAVVAEVQEVTWRDSSLGCPASGGMYLQVLTPGYRIVVRAGDTLLEYHAAEGGGRARLCGPAPSEARPPASGALTEGIRVEGR